MENKSHNLSIFREPKYVNKFRKYKLVVDDKDIFHIKNGETLNKTLPRGKHSIYARIDWVKSDKTSFNTTEDGETKLVVSMKKFNFFIQILAVILLLLGFVFGGILGRMIGFKYAGLIIGGGIGAYIYSYFACKPAIKAEAT